MTMASSRFQIIGVVLFVVALGALEAYQWDGGPKDKAKITTCVGGTASFPWSIVVGRDGDTILNLAWWFQASGKEKSQIATWQNGHFYATDTESLTFLPNAGLSLHDARPQDSGDYSVQVQLRRADSSFISVGRTVTLSVTDRSPATQDGALHVTLGDAVKDDVTEDWTLLLRCGHFVNLGHPPVDVVWTTPSGEVRNSSSEDNGTFVLSVSSVNKGNYSCQLTPSSPAARCLTATSPLTAAAQLYVDDKDVRLSSLEARQRELEQVNKNQANLLQHLAMQFSQQNGTMAGVMQVNTDQAKLLQRQAMQISQQNGTMAGVMQVNTDQAKLLQRQAMQISQQNGTIGELKASLLNQTTALNKTVNYVLGRINPANCVDWLKLDPRSAIRTVYISREPITVYCDQTTDNGGWIVFQRRQDASVDFYRNWTEYRNGFGDLEGNFWLGLDKLHRLSTSQRYEMRVDLHMWNGTKGSATYSGFYVDDVSQNFVLHYDNFTGGNAGDSMSMHLDQQFSTKERDNDKSWRHCAKHYHGAWWYWSCFYSNLNGDYKNSSSNPNKDGMGWETFGSRYYSMKFTEMKIRPI
ncbi:hypothetical protein V1264_010674 [Littorina saxatilis]|uniref:VIgL family fibrinogen-related protein 3 n=1 Tax=Littorina saxatilis TaxID=31220 RepID=A0AAN9AQA1_9CAEN